MALPYLNGTIYATIMQAVVVLASTHLSGTTELDNDADQFTDTIKLEIFDPNDHLIATGCGTAVAHRFELSRED